MMKSTIIFNCSTNIKGGAVQNAANFIISSINDNCNNEYYYLVSTNVYNLVKEYDLVSDKLYVIHKSPSRSINTRNYILKLASNINPDLIFTMAGPAYVDFKHMHLMGCSNPYILFASNKDIHFGRNYINFLLRYVHTKYQIHFIKKADYYLFQTSSSRDTFTKKFHIEVAKTFVAPNAIGFNSNDNSLSYPNRNRDIDNNIVRILCPFEKFPHKGVHIIPELMGYLDKNNIIAKFIVTCEMNINHNSEIYGPNRRSNISYIGVQKYSEMPINYFNCDIVFMPSILEIFSSVCTESLYFKKPLVVSDRVFNTDITGPYAFYCDPYSIESCGLAIMKAIKYTDNEEYLQSSKEYVLRKFGKYNHRYQNIRKIINSILLEV
jgi:hypothetical protein